MPQNIDGATPSPAAPNAAAKRVEVPSEPVMGRAGEAILARHLENVFLEPAAADQPNPEGEAGKPAPAAPPPGDDGASPENQDLSPAPEGDPADKPAPEGETGLSAEDQAALDERAKANGVTPEEQLAAETAELERLDKKAKETGLTIEEVAAQEEAEAARGANGEKKFSQQDVEELIQKRVKNLSTENAELKRQLNSQPPVLPGNGPLDQVTDAATLEAKAQEAQQGLDQAEDLLGELGADPEAVEEQLRQWLGSEADKADLTPAGMRRILRNAKSQFANVLKAVPLRKGYLEAQAKTREIVQKAAPWLNDVTDPRTVVFKQVEQAIPQLKASPTWEYWITAAVEKHLERQKASGTTERPAAPKGKFVPRVTFPKTASRGGSPAPKPATANDRIGQLKAELKKDPTNQKKFNALIEAMAG